MENYDYYDYYLTINPKITVDRKNFLDP